MARTVEKKLSMEYLINYPFKIETGWRIRIHIRWDDNIFRGGIGYVRFKITTEGYEESRNIFVNIFKIMARTVEKKWSTEALSNYSFRIETGWRIRIQIRWDNNLPICRLGYYRLWITTEGREELRLSSKAWCVRVMIGRFAEDSSDFLDRINIRIYISSD